MHRKRTKRLPPLFWQSLFILLPVAGLACFGLYSLREDRALAEQQARQEGQVLAQRLAQAISAEAVLNDYMDVSVGIDHYCLSASYMRGGAQSNLAWHRIQIWQKANPETDLASMPSATFNGYPLRMAPMPPDPPEWLLRLNAHQRQLWEAARKTELNPGDFASVQAAVNKFIESNPSASAQTNAIYLLLLAKTRTLPASEAAAEFAAHWSQMDYLSDAGVPLSDLVCYEALHLMPDGAGVPNNFLTGISLVISIGHPSFLTERLLAEAERVAKGTESESRVAGLKIGWERRQKALQVFDDFQKLYPKNGWKPGEFTVYSQNGLGQFLLFLGGRLPPPFTNGIPPCEYLLAPQAVIVKALGTAMKQSDISVPDYFQAGFEIGSAHIILPKVLSDGEILPGTDNEIRFVPADAKTIKSPNGSIAVLASDDFPAFGQADGIWQNLSRLNTTQTHFTYPFHVRVDLVRPEILYSRQRERARIFGGLIVLSAIAAITALFGAYRSFRRQEQLGEMKTNFVSSVSHELRAPIASVRLMAENLERGKIPEVSRQNEYFRFIVQECRRLSSLIENVLDFSRIEQDRKQYEFEPTDLVLLAQTTVKLLEPYAAERGVRLEMAHSASEQSRARERASDTVASSKVGQQAEGPAVPIELEVDSRALQQALVNLIDNAIKHSPKGEKVTVEITKNPASAEQGAVVGTNSFRNPQSAIRISIADHGPGIPREEHEKIFDRFYRLGSELRRETQGVGIGLSVVKHIIEAHGGRVIVESERGQGSRFTIELPIKNVGDDVRSL